MGHHGVFVLGGEQEVLDGTATFEVSLDPIPATDLFDTFTKTLCVGYDCVTLTLNFSGGSRGTVSTLVLNPINGLTGRPVETFLHLVQSPLGIFAMSENFPEVFFFLFEQLRIAAHSFGPMGEGVDNTELGREVMVAIKIIGREGHHLSRYIKESIFIRVNNPTLNNNVGKFNLPQIWDRVLINTPGLKLNK